MSFGQDFLQGFLGSDGLKDYSHASKTFRTDGYNLAPRNKFLFHVYFTINTSQIPALKASMGGGSDVAEIGLLVKNIQLPNYTMGVETMNQYNRKRLVQTKIDYGPVKIEFHDDTGDRVRNMWYNYFSYYYKDPSQAYGSAPNTNGSIGPGSCSPPGFDYNGRDIYSNYRPVNDWGYIGESFSDGTGGTGITGLGSGKPAFFQDIKIFGLSQHKFAEYVLINPMITDFTHDTYDYSQGNGIMSHAMTIKYETVKYYTGAVSGVRPDTNVVGFADPAYYDQVRSSLSRPGSKATVLGQGGLLDTGVGIIEDLQSGGVAGIIGAVQKAGATYNTFKGKDIASIALTEVKASATAILKGSIPGGVRGAIGTTAQGTPGGVGARPATTGSLDGVFFPTPNRAPVVEGSAVPTAAQRALANIKIT